MARGVRFWVTSSFIIISFGKKPVSGGRPAVDRSKSAMVVVANGEVDHIVVMFCRVFVDVSAINKNVGVVRMM